MGDNLPAPGILDVFSFGDLGVQLSDTVLDVPLGSWAQARNGQPSYDFALGGLEKRGGMAAFNADVLSAGVLSMSFVPLASLFDVPPVSGLTGLFAAVDALGAPYWLSSADGVTFGAPADLKDYPAGAVAKQMVTTYALSGPKFFFFSFPGLHAFDGTTVSALPALPTLGGNAVSSVGGLAFRDGVLYAGVTYATSDAQAVVAYDVSAGTWSVLGGTGTGGTSSNPPQRLFVDSTGAVYATDFHLIYRFSGGSWSLDANLGSSSSAECFAEFGGEVYCGTFSSPAQVIGRNGGAWDAVSKTFTTGTSGCVGGLAVFNGSLFALAACGSPDEVEVWVFSGSWSLDEDLLATFGWIPGDVIGTGVDLHAWIDAAGNPVRLCSASQFALLGRTTGGTWSTLHTAADEYRRGYVGSIRGTV